MLDSVNSNVYCETYTIRLFGNMQHLPTGGLLYFPLALAGRKPRQAEAGMRKSSVCTETVSQQCTSALHSAVQYLHRITRKC